jgi:hypothetical protein
MEIKMEMWKEDPSYYGGDELHKAKKEKIQKAMEENGLDAILLLKAETVRYATDFYCKGYRPFYEPEYLSVIPKGKDAVVGHTSGSDNYRIQIRSDIQDHRKLPGFSKWGDEVVKIFKDYGINSGRVGVELLPFEMYLQLHNEFPSIEFVDISKIWIDLTVVKHPAEIEHLRRAVDIAVAGCNAAIEFVKPGVKEYEVAAYAEYKMRAMGSEMTPFVTNVASGVNSAIFERISTDKVIEKDEMVIIDLGSVYRGYTGDVGRSVPESLRIFISKCTRSTTSRFRKLSILLSLAIPVQMLMLPQDALFVKWALKSTNTSLLPVISSAMAFMALLLSIRAWIMFCVPEWLWHLSLASRCSTTRKLAALTWNKIFL